MKEDFNKKSVSSDMTADRDERESVNTVQTPQKFDKLKIMIDDDSNY